MLQIKLFNKEHMEPLIIETYWEHGIGHMNAEHGSEMVKSSLSLAVPSSDCVSKEQNADYVTTRKHNMVP